MRQITADRGSFLISFEHDPAIAQAVTRLPGRRYNADLKAWTVPTLYGAPVDTFSRAHGFTLDDAAAEHIQQQATATVIDHNGGNYEVRFPYSNRALEQISQIPGAQWAQPIGAWLVPEGAEAPLQAFGEAWCASTTDAAKGAYKRAAAFYSRVAASGALTDSYELRPGFGLDLDPHQQAGVRYIIEHADGSAVVGDEPGVGKTAEAMAAMHELDAFPAYIFAPSKAKINWAREIQRALPGRTVEVLKGSRGRDRLMWADVTILNYEIAEGWEQYMPAARGVVVDESHNIMNPAAKRTQVITRIMDRVHEGGLKLVMTGTPALNKAEEFISQLRAIDRIEDLGGETAFRALCRKDPVAAYRKMAGTCYLRRRKMDVNPFMPSRRFVPIVVEGAPAIMAEYRKAEDDIVKFLAGQAEAAAAASGATTDEAKVEAWKATLKARAAEQLVAINHLRQLTARAKMVAAVQWSKDFLKGGRKLSMFGWHTGIVDEWADHMAAVKIQGGQRDEDSQRSVDLFQNEEAVRTIALQIKAGGVAITLTAGSDSLFLERAWNPGTEDQALDRHHRRGQENDVTGYVMMVEGTIDEDMDRIIEEKRKRVEAITDGIDPDETGGSVLQELVVSLASRGMNR